LILIEISQKKKVATLVWTLANVSGANLNPAVSIALLVTGETNLVRVLFYIPCQLLGSILAVLTLKQLNVTDSFIKTASIASESLNNTESKKLNIIH
jgi:glycerol uptake facilitator-like aquaporin